MKVLYVSQFSDFVGGGEYSLLDLILHLPPEVKAVLVTPAMGALADRADAAGVRTVHLPLPKVGRQSPSALRCWHRWLKREKPNLIHANSSRAAFYAGLSSFDSNIPVIFHCRVPVRDPKMDFLLRHLVSAIIANSSATAKRFTHWSKPFIHTIFNGLEISPIRSSLTKPFGARQLILIVGRLSDVKRQIHIVDLFPSICNKCSDIHLVLVGGTDPHNPSYAEQVALRINQSPLKEQMHLIGHVDDVGSWYACADILVLPSRFESFGRVLVEAMGSGIPVVAFSNGGIPEVVENGKQGILLKEGDWLGLVQKLQWLLCNDDQREEMGASGITRAQQFSIHRHVNAVIQVYRKMLNVR